MREVTMNTQCKRARGTRLATALLLASACTSAWAWDAGRMTGGGSIMCPAPIYRVTFGYELHCELEKGAISQPNNLEVNFSSGEHFHLERLTKAVCSGPNATKPDAPFNTLNGEGYGRLNGEEAATIKFTLVDNAEPGAGADTASFKIIDAAGKVVLDCGPRYLEGGNNQAHRATGNKP
jgi:hypothetical protein